MSEREPVEVMYFTDVLCIWAYLAQIRIDKMKSTFGTSIKLQHHFIPVFGSVELKLEKNWGAQGGVAGYNKHVRDIALAFSHIDVHPEIWMKNIPTTSASCHLFLKAVQLLEQRGELPTLATPADGANSIFESTVWEMRVAFFKNLVDISSFTEQMRIAEHLDLPLQKIEHLIKNGSAFAALDDDLQLKEKYTVSGSPTLILNEGRQTIYGNVGYRVIEANIQELLNQPQSQASWC